MENFIKKAGIFVPFAMAAAYFVFLIATWNRFLAFQQVLAAKVDEHLDSIRKPTTDNEHGID